MSDVIFARLRALLGTVGRRAGRRTGCPGRARIRPTRCPWCAAWRTRRGWKIRVEGRGTWLPPDAPADLAVSTRALEQVVSVSPADLVATVQAGASARGTAASAGRLRDVARHRSAGPTRPKHRLGGRDRHRGPAASRLRAGAGPRAGLHGRHRRRQAGERRRPGGEERGRLRSHQAPGRRLRRVRDHRRGASPAAGAAPGRRHPAGSRGRATRSPRPRAS